MTIMDLDAVDASGASGAVWSLPDSDELNANLVVLAPGDKIGRHVNDEVDVLVVVLSGRGVLVADEVVWHLQPHLTVLVPRGAARKITAALADDAADDEPLRYLSIHVARGGLEIRGAANATSAATRAIVDEREPVMPADATHADAVGAPPPGCPAHQPGVTS